MRWRKEKMKRLTTNDEKSILVHLNLFYAENNEVVVRGGGPEPDYADTTLVELIRRIAQTHSMNIVADNPESLGDEMYDAMFDGVDTIEGVVGLLHAAAVQAAEMRGRLEMIEDILGDEYDLDRLRERTQADQEGRCVVLPCKPSDVTVYQLRSKKHARGVGISPRRVYNTSVWGDGHYELHHQGLDDCLDRDLGKTWFLSREEAEAALREKEA